jgi:glycosyltransferase involved in cell wall biosynthesis
MKILLITTHLNFGGVASYTVSLARGLHSRGHKVFVASSGGGFEDLLKSEGIRHIRLPISTKSELSPKVLISSVLVRRFVATESIDIIHAQTRVTQIVAFIVAKAARIPYITTCHGFFKTRLGRKLFGAWGDRTVAISEAVREHLVNDFKLKKSTVELIYNGIALERFRDYGDSEKTLLKNRLQLKSGPVVGIIARLSPVKGHRYLIEAMKTVIAKIPTAQLLIVGDGPIKKELCALTERLGIANNVYFEESVSNTAEYLSIMDVFVLPSLQEGLGLSIAEALAMQLPVAASDVGGIYSLIKDNVTGLLVPAQNTHALAAAITTLLNDPSLCRRLGQAGRTLIEEKFSLGTMITKIEDIYKETIGDRHAT